MQEPGRKQKPFIKRRFWLVSAVFIVIVCLLILLVKMLSGPAEGTVDSSQAEAAKNESRQKQTQLYIGKHFSFSYPANYRVADTTTAKGSLEGVVLYATDHTNKQISVAVTQEALEGDSGLLLRKAHPETYALESSSPNRFVFSARQPTNEIAQFSSRGPLVASIDVSCPYQQNLQADFNQVSTSFKWN